MLTSRHVSTSWVKLFAWWGRPRAMVGIGWGGWVGEALGKVIVNDPSHRCRLSHVILCLGSLVSGKEYKGGIKDLLCKLPTWKSLGEMKSVHFEIQFAVCCGRLTFDGLLLSTNKYCLSRRDSRYLFLSPEWLRFTHFASVLKRDKIGFRIVWYSPLKYPGLPRAQRTVRISIS